MAAEEGLEGSVGEEGAESDDFGNFSDASFEEQDEVERYLEQLLPKDTCEPLSQRNGREKLGLVELLKDERPRVVYEQLVQLRPVLQPLNWNKSHLKSDLWHILRLPEQEPAARVPVPERPLDDSLYKKLRASLEDKSTETNTVLRDQFRFDYSVPLAPGSLQFEDEDDIPGLLTQSEENVNDLQKYHDQLCHAVDVLFGKLKQLQEQQELLISDKTTFENVVTNLTGHTQRLYRDEVALYNKKLKKRNKFSWGR